jgi:hypothetical protein
MSRINVKPACVVTSYRILCLWLVNTRGCTVVLLCGDVASHSIVLYEDVEGSLAIYLLPSATVITGIHGRVLTPRILLSNIGSLTGQQNNHPVTGTVIFIYKEQILHSTIPPPLSPNIRVSVIYSQGTSTPTYSMLKLLMGRNPPQVLTDEWR